MQRRVNVSATLACPQCRGELVVTLEQVQEEHVVHCPSCGLPVTLEPEDLGIVSLPAGIDVASESWTHA